MADCCAGAFVSVGSVVALLLLLLELGVLGLVVSVEVLLVSGVVEEPFELVLPEELCEEELPELELEELLVAGQSLYAAAPYVSQL